MADNRRLNRSVELGQFVFEIGLAARMARCVTLLGSVILAGTLAFGEDWPTYRHDTARSGITSEKIALPLEECWVFDPRHAPEPAWGSPNPRPVGGWYGLRELRRVHFDDVFHVVVAGDAVYFGSSADGNVYSLEATSGKVRWSALTGGPVRLAPTAWKDRVYVGSDDGFAYCLRASDGKEVWKVRVAPNDQKVLGSGKMISLWPSRTGVLVDEGTAYVGAGIFPAEGVYLLALRAEDGQVIWRNDTCGEAAMSRISPQGYLLASKTALFAPMGRVSPAGFDRKDGHLLHEAYFTHYVGGAYALLAGDKVFTGTSEIMGYDQKSPGARFAWFKGRQLIVTTDATYLATDSQLVSLDRKRYAEASVQHFALRTERPKLSRELRKAKQNAEKKLKGANEELAKVKKCHEAMEEEWNQAEATMTSSITWQAPYDCPHALILAGSVLYAGGQDHVVAVDAATGKKLWTGQVKGKAKGLAVAAGRLFVSTDTGSIYCFGPAGSKVVGSVRQPTNPSPYPRDELTPVFEAAAEHIIRTTGINRGYCLVLGCGTGRLAFELAKRTELKICGVEPDRQKVEAARKALDTAGLYGTRVLIDHGDLSRVPYSDYFANLVVSESALISGELPKGTKEAFRMLKPLGGTICIGQPVEAKGHAKPVEAASLQGWLKEAGVKDGKVTHDDGMWATFTRGPLPGAGSWTHQYAEPGNTACSDDQLVRCPLGLLWFGQPGPGKMAERHRRASAPLAIDGRFFVEGEGTAPRIGAGKNVIMAYDAYNGLKLWQRDIPGAIRTHASRTCSNMALRRDGLFVAAGDKCLRLDPATGETKATYSDTKPQPWGYVACVGGLLYGSRSADSGESDRLFAVDIKTGEVRWAHEAKQIPNNSIAIGDGQIFFVTSGVTDDERQKAIEEQHAIIKNLPEPLRAKAKTAPEKADVRMVVALDATTGQVRWKKPVDLTNCGGYHEAVPGRHILPAAMYNNGVFTLFGVYVDGHYWKQFFAGQFDTRRITALSGKDGKLLWSRPIGFRVRPLIIGDTLHAEPWAFDLHTGEQKTRVHPVTGRKEVWQFARPGHHCGCPAASPHTMLFRSYCLGYYDLDGDYGTMHFGSIRPGCWINFIPANGLLIMPEASSGCMCPFPNMCTVVLKPGKQDRAWAWFSSPGPMTPVKRLGVNFGAPGDRKDAAGKLWLGYPRPGGSLVLQFKIDVSFHSGGRFVKGDSVYGKTTTGTDDPWLFASAARGLRKCVVPLLGENDAPAAYRVRLAFADPQNDQPGRRVFDIKLQGKLVQEDFDIVKEAGGRNRAVFKQFDGIEVSDKLVIELVHKAGKPTAEQLPILQGVEIAR